MQIHKSALRRRLQIVELVRKKGEVSVETLSQTFEVSLVTIRSDLTYLEQQGYLVRTFGKARYQAQSRATLSPPSPVRNKALEGVMAKLAAACVEDDESLLLGSGVISHKVLPFLADRHNLALMLHDVAMVATAQQFTSGELRLTGGVLGPDSTIHTGPEAEKALAAQALDVCILEASALDKQGGLRVGHAPLARLFEVGQRSAGRTIVLAYQALGSELSGEVFGHLAGVHTLILDEAQDPATFTLLAEHGLQVMRKEGGALLLSRSKR